MTLIMPFLSDLSLTSVRGSRFFTLDKPLTYQHGEVIYSVPTGFKTDFASIPRVFQNIIGDDESDIRDASVIHDFLYSTGSVTRLQADRVLQAAMLDLGASKLKAYLVFIAVRLGGSSHYGAE